MSCYIQNYDGQLKSRCMIGFSFIQHQAVRLLHGIVDLILFDVSVLLLHPSQNALPCSQQQAVRIFCPIDIK